MKLLLIPAVILAGLFDNAFGDQPDFWRATSPYEQLTAQATPFLLVCSTRRSDSCPANRAFAVRAISLGVSAAVLEEDLSHRQINDQLGLTRTRSPSRESGVSRNFILGFQGPRCYLPL